MVGVAAVGPAVAGRLRQTVTVVAGITASADARLRSGSGVCVVVTGTGVSRGAGRVSMCPTTKLSCHGMTGLSKSAVLLTRFGRIREDLGLKAPTIAGVYAARRPRRGTSGYRRLMQWVVGLVYAGFLVGTGVLALVDARANRLPDKVTFPLYAWGALGLTAASWVGGQWWRMIVAAGAALLCYGFFWLQWFFGKVGFGDVKLVGVLGLFLGWVSLPLAMAGLLAGMIAASLVSLGRVALRKAKLKSQVAFGSYLIAGAWAALAAEAVELVRR